MQTAEQFWAMVDWSPACWNWLGSLTADGYGRLRWRDAGKVRASRLAYELAVGPIPAGLHIDHLCRNRSCVNPAHLEPVTQRENVLRGDAAQPRGDACQNGHRYVAGSWRIRSDGHGRECLACRRQRTDRYALRVAGAVS